MTITKLVEVIYNELERVDWLTCESKCHGGEHRVMISIEPTLFNKVLDRMLGHLITEDALEKTKLDTDVITYVDYTLVRQKKNLNKL